MGSLLKNLCVLSIIVNLQQINGKHFTKSPKLNVGLTDAGFYRNLIYNVQFDLPLVGKDCEYILRQPLPASVYVSVDQLDDMQRLQKLDAFYPSFVDIEKPTEQSSEFEVFLKGVPKSTDTIILPIHFRYHAPKDQSSFVSVSISSPTMYIKCPKHEQHLMENVLQIEQNTIYCLDERVPSLRQLTSWQKLDEWNEAACSWKYVVLDVNQKSVLSVEIPVGNQNAYPLFLYATIALSWIVSLWTVIRTRHIPRAINEKLEEQRLLQRKYK